MAVLGCGGPEQTEAGWGGGMDAGGPSAAEVMYIHAYIDRKTQRHRDRNTPTATTHQTGGWTDVLLHHLERTSRLHT